MNDTLYCHTGKATGDFDSSHWDFFYWQQWMHTAKAESAITSVDYLTEVMQSGTTEINGGLVLTNVLALRDTDNTTITGGIVVLKRIKSCWGGGTYEDAEMRQNRII